MSQNQSEALSNETLNPSPQYSFEQFILQCCKAPEHQLRKWFHKILPRYGFSIIEDEYKGIRVKDNPVYSTVHNMLAIRGKPKVCLVAHTDVCRDHDRKDIPKVNPVIKTVKIDEEGTEIVRRVIQDRLNEVQVGGDDRLGVAIITWIALNTGYDLALYFPTDEERGLRSADACKLKELKEFDLCVQVDRGNHSHELVTKIGGVELCDYDHAIRLLEIAFDIGLPRKPVVGMGTDVVALKRNNMIKNAVNMTCGYHQSHGADPTEYIEIKEAEDTLRYVAEIVKDWDQNGPC